jgi:hypothetical protein
MSNLTYYALFENGSPVSLTVIVAGQAAPIGYTEISYADYENYQNDMGNLDALRLSCLDQIDAHAGDVRMDFITSVPGQESTYLMKAQEAREVKAAGYVADMLLYPLIAAEIAAQNNASIQAVVDDILTTENQWRQLAAIIEKERRLGKIAVKTSTTTVDILLAKNAALGALESIRATYK